MARLIARQRPWTIGVQEFRSSLGKYLRLISKGNSIIVTRRGRPVARLVPPDMPEGIVRMLREGTLRWSGRKFRARRPRVQLRGRGKTLADYVIEDRR